MSAPHEVLKARLLQDATEYDERERIARNLHDFDAADRFHRRALALRSHARGIDLLATPIAQTEPGR